MMVRGLIAMAALAALVACGQPQQRAYPADYAFNFKQACERQSQVEGLCDCTWDGIAAQISPNDFAALERLPGPERENHPLTRQIEQITLACHATLNPPPEGEPTPEP